MERESPKKGGMTEYEMGEEGLIGTAEYIAPEALKRCSFSYATDLWALGIIIYKIFTGKTPFRGASQSQTFSNIEKASFTMQLSFLNIKGEGYLRSP
jgi:serine/threonine protein kinase